MRVPGLSVPLDMRFFRNYASIMGVGVRNFVFEETGNISVITQTRIDRLLRCEERIPYHVGRPVRIATVFLEMCHRKPVSALSCGFWLMHFNPGGYVNEKKEFEGLRMAMSILHGTGVERNGTVLDINRKLYERRYRIEHTWTPTSEEWVRFGLLVGRLLGEG